MPLEPGTTLGPYAVTAKIGQGGMGEVWQARDTKLDRDVALKVLPDAFTSDPDRLARFEREAKVLASLNHPNIGAIHGFEESGATKALVLELVEGPTLADRIADGPIPVDESLAIAKQIAEALEAAHEQGIIHRDLKPANVKVKADGTVKVLDFGLAKAFQPEASGASASESPTISLTAAATQMGMVIGTAAYMAPEQAKGKPVGKQADVWAFGVVLYEMLTGTRPFAGEDVSETLARVIDREPEWETLPDKVPVVLSSFLRHCLQKNRKQRIRDIGDVSLAMEGAFETTASTSSEPAVSTPLQFWQRPVPALVVMVLVAVIAGLAVWSVTRSTAPASPALRRFAIDLGPADPIAVSTVRVMPAVSPDGTQLVYAANVRGTQQLYLRTFDQLDAQPITGSENAYEPFFSPDGEWVGFVDPFSSALKRVSVRGGQALTLAACFPPNGATWLPDGTIVASCIESGLGTILLRIPVAGGTLDPLTTLDADNGEVGHSWPRVLPGGGALLFTIVTDGQRADASRVAVLSLDTGEQHTVVEGGYNARYVPTGHLIFGRQGSLWGVPFDVDRLVTTGREELVLPEVELNEGYGSMALAVSGDGTLVYLPGEAVNLGDDVDGAGRPVWVDRAGQATPIGEGRRNNALRSRLSPDNTRLATTVASTDGQDVWVDDLERGTSTRLTNDGNSFSPAWSPDGARVSFGSFAPPFGLFSRAADGSGERETVLTGEEQIASPYGWTPDGQAMLFWEGQVGDGALWTVSPEGDRSPYLVGPGYFTGADLSPDGRWMAYGSDESGQLEIYLQRYPDLGDKVTVSSGGGREARWSPDGSELFYRNLAGDRMMVVEVETEPTLRVSRPEVLFEGRYAVPVGGGHNYDVSADGQRFVMITDEQAGTPDASPPNTTLILVENWFEELKRLAPVP